jgi:SAM-dependent methyltransferase
MAWRTSLDRVRFLYPRLSYSSPICSLQPATYFTSSFHSLFPSAYFYLHPSICLLLLFTFHYSILPSARVYRLLSAHFHQFFSPLSRIHKSFHPVVKMALQQMTNRDEIRQHYTTQTNSGAMDSYPFGNTLLLAVEARVVSTSSNLDKASILDVGCGAGFLITRIGARSQGKVIGIDLTQACVNQANHNIQNAELPNNSNGERVRAVCQDIRALRNTDMAALRRETPNGQGFDFIFAITLFQHIPQDEHAQVSNQLVRLLCNGGRLFLHLQGHSTSCFAYMVGTVFVTTYPAPNAQVQQPLLLPPVFNLPSHGQLQPITVVAPLWPASEAQRIDQDARSFASTLAQSVDILTTYDLARLFAGLMPTYEELILAGYLVIPNTFTSLQSSKALSGNKGGQIIQSTVQNVRTASTFRWRPLPYRDSGNLLVMVLVKMAYKLRMACQKYICVSPVQCIQQ